MRYLYLLSALFGSALLSGCSDNGAGSEASAPSAASAQPAQKLERWYSSDLVSQGQVVFTQNCAVCHGQKAQGVVQPWNQPLKDGRYPAPPLNGSAHAWHHPLKGLIFTISNGGAPVGGKMPSFKNKLSTEEQAAAVAYFQHFWSDKIYQAWLNRGGLK